MIRVNRLVGSFFRRVSIKRLLVPPLHLWLVTLLLVAVIGVGGSVAGWQAVLNDQDSALHQRFESLAQDRAAAIQQEVNGSLQELYALRALFEEQTTVSRSSFRAFVDELPATRALQAVEWIPQVPAGERSQYEAAARADGFPSFQITEHNAGGQLVAAGARSEYYPVYYAEPTQGNLAALGFDLASEPTRRSALLQALNTGQPATTTGIRLVQETGSQWGVLIYLPVLRADVARTSASPPGANLEGFVLGVIRTGDLVETSLSRLTPGGIDLALWDTSDPSAKEPLSPTSISV